MLQDRADRHSCSPRSPAQELHSPGGWASSAQQAPSSLLAQAVADQTRALTEAMERSRQSNRASLIDSRGLGKPKEFDGKSDGEEWLPWKLKTENYFFGVFPELKSVMRWAEERIGAIDAEALQSAFGPSSDEPCTK